MWERVFRGEKILEIGCGIGLASLALTMRAQNVSATDRHPETHGFLSFNTRLNELPSIPFERCSWELPESSLGRFDLIIGSDLLYETTSLDPLSRFIDRHAREVCEVLIVDPNRGLRARFSKSMANVGFLSRPHRKVTDHACDGYKGSILGFEREREMVSKPK